MKPRLLITILFLLQANSCDEYDRVISPTPVEPKYSDKVSGYIKKRFVSF